MRYSPGPTSAFGEGWGYQVFVEVAPESGLGLRLRGSDPTAPRAWM